MPKAVTTMEMTLLPPNKTETGLLSPRDALRSKKFFQELKEDAQETFLEKDRKLTEAIVVHGMSGFAIGQILSELKQILTEGRKFHQYMRSRNLPPRTGYRYIKKYENAAQLFGSEAVLRQAVIRNLKIGNDDLVVAVKQLGPPKKSDDLEYARDYVKQIQSFEKERRRRRRTKGKSLVEVVGDPEKLMETAFRITTIGLRRLPANSRKMVWLEHLVGMLLSTMGVSSRQFDAVGVPEKFKTKPGRPKLLKKSKERERDKEESA